MYYSYYVRLFTNFNELDLTQENQKLLLSEIKKLIKNSISDSTVINGFFEVMYESNGCLHLKFQTKNRLKEDLSDSFESNLENLFSENMTLGNIEFSIDLSKSYFSVRLDNELIFNNSKQTGIVKSLSELPEGTCELFFIGLFPKSENEAVFMNIDFLDSEGNSLPKPKWYEHFFNLYSKTFSFEDHDGIKIGTLKNFIFGTEPSNEIIQAIQNESLKFNTYMASEQIDSKFENANNIWEVEIFLDFAN